jgi:hypothetical protein
METENKIERNIEEVQRLVEAGDYAGAFQATSALNEEEVREALKVLLGEEVSGVSLGDLELLLRTNMEAVAEEKASETAALVRGLDNTAVEAFVTFMWMQIKDNQQFIWASPKQSFSVTLVTGIELGQKLAQIKARREQGDGS